MALKVSQVMLDHQVILDHQVYKVKMVQQELQGGLG